MSKRLRPLVENGAPRARALKELRRWIAEGILPRGAPLPSENALAVKLGVGRATVGRALSVLGKEGLLVQHSGRTRLVASVPPTRGALVHKTVAVLTTLEEKDLKHMPSGWSAAITEGIIQAIREAGLHALALHPGQVTAQEIEQLVAERPFGVAIPEILQGPLTEPSVSQAVLDKLRASGVPFVAYGDLPVLADCDRVTSNHEAGAYALTRWLLSAGRQRILMLWDTPMSLYWCGGRRAGYERALREAGMTPLPVVEMIPFQALAPNDEQRFEAWRRYMAGYLAEHLNGPEPVDAVMLASDGEVPPAAAACRLLGKRPCQDVYLVGYDNYWSGTPWRPFEACVPQATVDKLNYQCGQEMVRLLMERAQGRLPKAPQRRVVEPRFVVLGT